MTGNFIFCIVIWAVILDVIVASPIVHISINGRSEGQNVDLENCKSSKLSDIIKEKLELEGVFNIYSVDGSIVSKCSHVKDSMSLYIVPIGQRFKRPNHRRKRDTSGDKPLSWTVVSICFGVCIIIAVFAVKYINSMYHNERSNAFFKAAFADEERLKRNMVSKSAYHIFAFVVFFK